MNPVLIFGTRSCTGEMFLTKSVLAQPEKLFTRNTRCGLPMATDNLLPRLIEGVPDATENSWRIAKFY